MELERLIDKYISAGVATIGIDTVKWYFEYLLTISNLPIVSVGSGPGVVERILDEAFAIDCICVDPAPKSYINAPEAICKLPAYSFVQYLIDHKIGIVGKCCLLLNWSNPNDSTYDYDALVALKPQFLIWIGETSGTAGGKKMLQWLKNCGIDMEVEDEILVEYPTYNLIKEYHIDGYDNFAGWPTSTTIAILQMSNVKQLLSII